MPYSFGDVEHSKRDVEHSKGDAKRTGNRNLFIMIHETYQSVVAKRRREGTI
jgi:hypothetical protein